MDDWEDDLLALAEEPVKKKKKKDKKKKRRESSGSDMEIGGSGSDMDLAQSDSDDEAAERTKQASNDEDDEIRPEMYPLEGIYKDASDRAELANMNEMEREMVLEDRREKLQKYHDRQALKQMVADQEGGAASSDGEAPARSSRRRKEPTGKAKQLEELKRKRQSKSEREQKKAKKRANGDSDYDSDEENRARKSPSVPIYTDSEEEADSDTDKHIVAKKKAKTREPATLEELKRICIPRGKLAAFWPCSFFPEYVEGAYVRMGVGQEKGEPIYRLAKIEKVAEKSSSRLYKLEKHMTDVKLTLIIGNDKKDMTMEMVSNTEPTEREFNRYMLMLNQAKIDLPTKTAVDNKLEVMEKHKDYTLTEADINVILAKKRQHAQGDLHERHTLRNARDIAIRAGNSAEVARIDEILARMDVGGGSASPLKAANGAATQAVPANMPKAAATLEDRRRNLAMANTAIGTPKAVAGKTASPAVSRPVSGTTTPQRTASATNLASLQNAAQAEAQKQNKFQKMLASKVDIDLGDF